MYTTTSNARYLGVGVLMDDNYNASHQKLLLSTKVLESHHVDPVSVQERTSSSRDGIVFHESHVVKPKDTDSILKEMKQNREISAVGVRISKPLVSVAGRRVARKNLDERTGFFSDYSTPRTRPPSHN
ncbi:hypothetical protein REPUB_Repub08aG0004600 [Reevesia pubescens]